jgi:preprotein translocase subunit Sss1
MLLVALVKKVKKPDFYNYSKTANALGIVIPYLGI